MLTVETGEAAPAGARVRTVLVADDDPHINRLFQVLLRHRGYAVLGAANGREALAMLETTPADLLFLDVAMPDVGGMAVLEQVRARALDLAVIMITAFGSEEIAIEALRRGADDYLRKPFERDEFQTVLDRTVERLELRRINALLHRELAEQHRQLEQELSRAARVQADLLPREAPRLPGFELAGRCLPAREVGGDFFDWFEARPGLLSLTLGDVMGKGMPAALLMATVRAALRGAARRRGPAETLESAAAALEDDLARAESFTTLFHARLDLASRRLTYVDAGHGYALLRRADGSVEALPGRQLPLGVLPGQVYEEGSVLLQPGDALVLYSDGLPEGVEQQTLHAAALGAQLAGASSAQTMVDRLLDLASGPGQHQDDLTVVVLRCTERDE